MERTSDECLPCPLLGQQQHDCFIHSSEAINGLTLFIHVLIRTNSKILDKRTLGLFLHSPIIVGR